MGTAAYMSPEQARGREGRQAHRHLGVRMRAVRDADRPRGRSLRRQPRPRRSARDPAPRAGTGTALPARRRRRPCGWSSNGASRRTRRARLRDIGDVQLALTGAFSRRMSPEVVPPPAACRLLIAPLWRRAGSRPGIPRSSVALVTAAGDALSAAETLPAQVTRLSIGARGEAALHVDGQRPGTRDHAGRLARGLCRRRRPTDFRPRVERARAGGDCRRYPSQESVRLARRAVGRLWRRIRRFLKKVPIAGGPANRHHTEGIGLLRGAVWLADNTIIFGTDERSTGLQRVSADGGTPQPLTTPDAARNEYDHYWPEVLPDGRGILYTILARDWRPCRGEASLFTTSRRIRRPTCSRGGSNAMYLRSGHLVYMAGRHAVGRSLRRRPAHRHWHGRARA